LFTHFLLLILKFYLNCGRYSNLNLLNKANYLDIDEEVKESIFNKKSSQSNESDDSTTSKNLPETVQKEAEIDKQLKKYEDSLRTQKIVQKINPTSSSKKQVKSNSSVRLFLTV